MIRPHKVFYFVVVLIWLVACQLGSLAPTSPVPLPTAALTSANTSSELEFAYLVAAKDAGFPPSLYYYSGSASQKLLDNVIYFSWSPDGQQIAAEAFLPGSNSEVGIFVINMQGFRVEQIALGSHPTWAPDGHRIAYEAVENPQAVPPAFGIYVMDLQGKGQAEKVAALNRASASPSWSPDGKWIAFRDYTGVDYALYTINMTNLERREIMAGLRDDDLTIAWSPDSSRIAFEAAGNNNAEIYTADVNGVNIRRLTQNEFLDYRPSWSPDGTRILFVSHRVNDTPQIFLMNSDGSNVIQLTNKGGRDPAWSSDGLQILYAADSIYVMKTDGSDETPVSPVESGAFYPKWRP